jgi:tRNA threonylcarbamoyladenosine biosynthesis protein TsaE
VRLGLRTKTAEDTRMVGQTLAGLLRARDAVILTGDLGAGKTTLVQGVARGLGVSEHVASPTFTLVREYTGRLAVAHVDVYRLDRMQEVLDLGLEELGSGDDLLLVEWGDAVQDLLPDDRIRIELTAQDPESEERQLAIEAEGQSWTDRWESLRNALAPWETPA